MTVLSHAGETMVEAKRATEEHLNKTTHATSSLGIGRTAVAISSGYEHTCAILDDGSVSCWGNGGNGRLGNGGTSDELHLPQRAALEQVELL